MLGPNRRRSTLGPPPEPRMVTLSGTTAGGGEFPAEFCSGREGLPVNTTDENTASNKILFIVTSMCVPIITNASDTLPAMSDVKLTRRELLVGMAAAPLLQTTVQPQATDSPL